MRGLIRTLMLSLRLGLCAVLVFWPALEVTWNVYGGSLARGEIPASAYRWHRSLAERFGPWAEARRTSGRAEQLGVEDISGTEWPLFGALSFIWSTDNLQTHWLASDRSEPEPAVVARAALNAAVDLLADPRQAHWVREHWGAEYLDRDNLFYRMMLIGGIDTFEKLTADERHHALLRNQLTTLADELERSPHGLLEDYPDQCYPVDVLMAYAVIARAERRLGIEHPEFVERGWRAFSGERLDPATGLPAYYVDAQTGVAHDVARGVGQSAMLIFAPELWPERSRDWYASYAHQYWQSLFGIVGFREYALGNGGAPDFMLEVDAGPVILGWGTGASGFGLGAARAAGANEHAVPLMAEAVFAAWPLPDGTLLIPRLLSNLSDAPYLGEAALLFNMTRPPVLPKAAPKTSVPIPHSVPVALVLVFLYGLWTVHRGLVRYRVAVLPKRG